jgi:hypothetical protein
VFYTVSVFSETRGLAVWVWVVVIQNLRVSSAISTTGATTLLGKVIGYNKLAVYDFLLKPGMITVKTS